MSVKAIIFDFNRTLFDPEKNKLMNGCLSTLEVLSKTQKLALITNKAEFRQNLIEELRIKKFFQKIVMTSHKNELDFLKCCLTLGVKLEETVMVGDRVKGEIAIANKLGMFTIQFLNGKFASELPNNALEQPKVIITKLRELLKIIPKLRIKEKS